MVIRPIDMKTALAALALATLAACGSTDATVAQDPGSQPQDNPMPTAVPAADGRVHTRGPVTVMDTGRPELCLGPVAESWPPQCGGPRVREWEWADFPGRFERQGEVRWGDFAVSGTWDGTSFTLTDAIPVALYDAPAPEEPTAVPAPGRSYTQRELQEIADEVGGGLPGAQGAFADDGHVFVDVVFDDGSLQAWADEEFGADVVVVASALVS